MMPQLRPSDRHQTHLDRKPRQRSDAHFTKVGPPSSNCGCIEIAGFAERFLAQKLRDKRRFGFHVKAVQRRAKDNFVPACYRFWHPTFGQESQQVLIPKSTKAPTRMQFRQEIEDILVQKWISHFD